MTSAPRVLLLCGGRSAEHAVSLASARAVVAAAAGLPVTPVVIARDGSLLGLAESRQALSLPPVDAPAAPTAENDSGTRAERPSDRQGDRASDSEIDRRDDLQTTLRGFDVVFPLLHGPYGEDGRVQGLLDVMGIPYVGSGVLASAVGMDKLAMKAAFAAEHLEQVAYEPVTSAGWRAAPEEVRARLARLGYPLFVKPANLGSSIGISKVTDAAGLEAALATALAHDRRVIVEAAAVGARELEVAVLGNATPAASPVGEVKYSSAFYDYEAKYSDGFAELCVPADVPEAVATACREAALRAFAAIDARGLARVDFFYLPDSGALLLNEINTMPGFTPHSMYPRLWAQAGVAFPELVRRLVALALEPA